MTIYVFAYKYVWIMKIVEQSLANIVVVIAT